MSFPLNGQLLTFRQPDGTTFNVHGWGDQNHAIFKTPDGNPVVLDPLTGYYHYATTSLARDELRPLAARVGLDFHAGLGAALQVTHALAMPGPGAMLPKPRWKERWEMRISDRRATLLSSGIHPAPPARQTIGSFVGLCLPVEFPDERATIDASTIDNFCNQLGFSGFGNNGSVFDYFHDNSGGRLSYRTLVAPYYLAQHPKTYYTDPSVTFGQRARDLIQEAISHHVQSGLDFSSLTVDDQGAAFAMNVLYAGPTTNNWSQGLWPHASRLAAPFTLTPHVNAVDYQISSIGADLALGTYCHENGHMLCDFPDLYEYADPQRGVGRFCLMCLGCNADPHNPTNVCAYLKRLAGWGSSAPLTSGQRVQIDRGANTFLLFEKGAGEYFVVENRQKFGRDAALPNSGLAVWHIDELGSNAEPTLAPSGHRRHECVLVQADGLGDLDMGNNDGDVTDLFQDSAGPIFSAATSASSQWWDGTASGLQMQQVQTINGNVAFSVA